jgi:CBS domain containing-hemolysin-like protein
MISPPIDVSPALSAGAGLPREAITVAGAAMLVVLVGLSAFFSSAEIALFSLARHRIDALVEDGAAGAETVRELTANPHRLLVTILVGNNLANVAMSSLATGLLGMYFGHGEAVLAATFGVTAVVLLFGESAPKSYAVEHSESWSLRIARPLALSERMLSPLVVVFDRLTRIVNRMTGGRAAIESTYVTRDEIRELIESGEREGVIDAEERRMLQRILRFRDTIAKEVMTPRLDATAIPADGSVAEALATCTESGHERLPVYRRNLDTVVGVVTLDALLQASRTGDAETTSVTDVTDPIPHVPESKNVAELLEEMRNGRDEMVIVVDEFGTTEGLITTEDLVEEIVGEILDDEEESPIEFVGDNAARVRGEVNVEVVNEALDVALPEGEEFETIAGFVFNRAGRLVEAGEAFTTNNVELRVESIEHTRIKSVRVSTCRESSDTSPDADSVVTENA